MTMFSNARRTPHAARRTPHLKPLIAGLLLAIPFSNAALSATVVTPAPKPVYKIKLNDTGITTCWTKSVQRGCPLKDYPGQDAQYGRDKTQRDFRDGDAGFSFTKISNIGKPLLATASKWNCVKDNITGLMWEGKTDDNGLHDMHGTYTWYEPNAKINGGDVGRQNGGACSLIGGCDTYDYVKAVNKAGWCGYKDWRMPTKQQLNNLTVLHLFGLPLDPSYFPEENISAVWSSSPLARYSDSAWIVDFSYGGDYIYPKSYGNQVRLVRSGQ
ncbi:DUF1566 domain-containing protein [Crenothrix sp.]|uniref:Lcl C-terminal domain-containing protein n=1 Tax=Crenothrix sp. TaxID=3100433 RepID=UPI00374D3ABA